MKTIYDDWWPRVVEDEGSVAINESREEGDLHDTMK